MGCDRTEHPCSWLFNGATVALNRNTRTVAASSARGPGPAGNLHICIYPRNDPSHLYVDSILKILHPTYAQVRSA